MGTSRVAIAAATLLVHHVALAAIPSAELPVWARGGKIWADTLAARAAEGRLVGNSTTNFYTQQVDHSDASRGTYQQRYYVDTTYYSSGGPVFIYIGGEGNLGGTPTGFVAEYAQQHKALIVALEHRWYGQSIPGDITSTPDLQTLTVDQALTDLATFVAWYDPMISEGSALGLPATPHVRVGGSAVAHVWLAIGGSYPGALSAWAREVHPELFAASWSSSGEEWEGLEWDAGAGVILLWIGLSPWKICVALLDGTRTSFLL